MLNYLARLGWSHGDEEMFSREQMIEWFDGGHLAKSPAQWDAAKLAWVNAHYLKALADDALLALVAQAAGAARHRSRRRRPTSGCCAPLRLFKDRCNTGAELADWLAMLFVAGRRRRRGAGAARHRRRAARRSRPCATSWTRPPGTARRHRRGDQGNAGRARPEDAAARPGGAGAGLRPGADAVARCGARAVRPRGRSGAAAEGRLKPRYNLGLSR